jgi:hypothetical protein
MGTKNKPGVFDCYANAGPDEPMFVLLGRDRFAPSLVRLWAIMRSDAGEDFRKIEEALQCADAMDEELRRRGKDPVDASNMFFKVFDLVTSSLGEHPSGYDGHCMCHECQIS